MELHWPIETRWDIRCIGVVSVSSSTMNSQCWFALLKLYCGYLYTRPCMIICIWGLKQLWLQVNGHAWFHLHEIHWAVRNRMGLKNSKWKYVSLNPTNPRHDQWYSALDRSTTLVRYQLGIYSLNVSWYITYRHVTIHVGIRLCLIANATFCKQLLY